jgi:hypothetical protein
MQRLQYGLRMRFRDAQEGAGDAFGAAVALFPFLEVAGADADESRKLNLAEWMKRRPPRLPVFLRYVGSGGCGHSGAA